MASPALAPRGTRLVRRARRLASDVALRNDRSYSDPVKSLIEETRAKGANTLLYEPQSDGAMKHGVGYQCALPPASQKSQP